MYFYSLCDIISVLIVIRNQLHGRWRRRVGWRWKWCTYTIEYQTTISLIRCRSKLLSKCLSLNSLRQVYTLKFILLILAALKPHAALRRAQHWRSQGCQSIPNTLFMFILLYGMNSLYVDVYTVFIKCSYRPIFMSIRLVIGIAMGNWVHRTPASLK